MMQKASAQLAMAVMMERSGGWESLRSDAIAKVIEVSTQVMFGVNKGRLRLVSNNVVTRSNETFIVDQ